MTIDYTRAADANEAVQFVDDVRSAYNILKRMQTKIARYGTGAAGGTDVIFVSLVETLVDAGDITRIAALVTPIGELVALLEADYDDFINPA